MKKIVLFFVIALTLLAMAAVPALSLAETMEGMDHDEGQMQSVEGQQQQSDKPPPIPAGRGDGTADENMEGMDHSAEGYKPPEVAADDSFMAVVASAVFGLPVVIWFVSRSLKKAKKAQVK